MSEPQFPPLLTGLDAEGRDPFALACEMAEAGCDGGTLVHSVRADRLQAAVIFAPEVPLAEAAAVLVVCGVGLQNALGALAPPEVAVHLEWDGGIRVNGGACGRLSLAGNTRDPEAVPGWLVVGLDLTLIRLAEAPGETPDVTSLYDEGCAEVDPVGLLEAYARHMLVWLNRWDDEGNRPLHAEWSGLAWGLNGAAGVAGRSGVFIGTDERFGMLLRDGETTHLVPLSALVEEGP
ncbi:biotin/lipoate--protein ligase family protein [Seohaeicola zhoushanensis]|uniref:Biotin-(Acetyl-CoA carboxylase) ligase n=1 Tax=Seohaeicola zhoushanensis TaxID=1569283 RepID=A0A8J3M736_9RHOB|nr:biotin/lipoate--protein ligase family protein [Seohaeicola zhoushanensis]GHF44014.1 hypothetical protein GCM10017056_14930 [Seohaeicola zhoushanensis]